MHTGRVEIDTATTMTTKYEPAGTQAEFESGSRGKVLRNRLGILRVRDMSVAESHALLFAQEDAVEKYGTDHRFRASDIRALHKLWLDPIYPWAGQYRTVNIGKGGFQFAHTPLIPGLMDVLERGPLRQHTPLKPALDARLAAALAEVHAELILIHPFREGNGRLARLLALLMGFQAGLPPLDFASMAGRGKLRYISAIHAAAGRNYAPLTAVFARIIAQSRRRAAANNQ